MAPSEACRRRLVVLSAPSGAGKTTIAHALLERHSAWRFSVSATTRPLRPGEVHGRDYYFLDMQEFRQRIHDEDLVEWEELFGNLYGTLKSEIRRLLDGDEQRRIVFDVDVKGALAIRKAFPDDTILIFIAPPSFEELRRRLEGRHTETPQVIEQRTQRAEMEMQMQPEFDAVVVNDRVERAVAEIETLLGVRQ